MGCCCCCCCSNLAAMTTVWCGSWNVDPKTPPRVENSDDRKPWRPPFRVSPPPLTSVVTTALCLLVATFSFSLSLSLVLRRINETKVCNSVFVSLFLWVFFITTPLASNGRFYIQSWPLDFSLASTASIRLFTFLALFYSRYSHTLLIPCLCYCIFFLLFFFSSYSSLLYFSIKKSNLICNNIVIILSYLSYKCPLIYF